MISHTQIISKKTVKTPFEARDKIHSITYKLSNNPFRLYSKFELPKKYEFSDWESDDDTWIKKNGQFYNLRDFCTIGAPVLPGPYGGIQLAHGDFTIGVYGDRVHSVNITERKDV